MVCYNAEWEHSSIGDATLASRFLADRAAVRVPAPPRPDRTGEQWLTRRVARNGVVFVGYQQVSVGKHFAGSACDVLPTGDLRKKRGRRQRRRGSDPQPPRTAPPGRSGEGSGPVHFGVKTGEALRRYWRGRRTHPLAASPALCGSAVKAR